MKTKREAKGSWIVRVEVTRIIDVVCKDCTEEQARNETWEHATDDELMVDQIDWEVMRVEPNQ